MNIYDYFIFSLFAMDGNYSNEFPFVTGHLTSDVYTNKLAVEFDDGGELRVLPEYGSVTRRSLIYHLNKQENTTRHVHVVYGFQAKFATFNSAADFNRQPSFDRFFHLDPLPPQDADRFIIMIRYGTVPLFLEYHKGTESVYMHKPYWEHMPEITVDEFSVLCIDQISSDPPINPSLPKNLVSVFQGPAVPPGYDNPDPYNDQDPDGENGSQDPDNIVNNVEDTCFKSPNDNINCQKEDSNWE